MIDTSQDELLVTNESDDDSSQSPHSDIGNIIYIRLYDIIKNKLNQTKKNAKTINSILIKQMS